MPVDVRNRLRRTMVRVSVLTTMAQTILALAGEEDAELGIELIGTCRMQGLNRQFRGVDEPTDVLAFSLRESPGPRSSLLGDVVIAVPVAARQAKDLGHAIDEELTRLLIHGVLHLFGYDHERSEHEARRMRRKEKRILCALYPLPKLVTVKKYEDDKR
ncbi:MAG: rRNA maturation RNase YbeY [Nitrospirales bacterium]|nr:rRNA maturation RNase YbeY [Nitrospirales bacterium]